MIILSCEHYITIIIVAMPLTTNKIEGKMGISISFLLYIIIFLKTLDMRQNYCILTMLPKNNDGIKYINVYKMKQRSR